MSCRTAVSGWKLEKTRYKNKSISHSNYQVPLISIPTEHSCCYRKLNIKSIASCAIEDVSEEPSQTLFTATVNRTVFISVAVQGHVEITLYAFL